MNDLFNDEVFDYQVLDIYSDYIIYKHIEARHIIFAEGFGIPPLESVACGIPTVSSNTTAMNDFYFIKEFLFNPYSMDDFNSKILKALHDPKEENILSEMKKSYDWGKSAEVFYKRISK